MKGKLKKSEYPELEGTMKLCEDVIQKRTGKMTEEEWQAAERAQTGTKQETLEEAAKNYTKTEIGLGFYPDIEIAFEKGAKWKEERMYSEEEVIDFLQEMNDWPTTFEGRIDIREWFEQFKKPKNEIND